MGKLLIHLIKGVKQPVSRLLEVKNLSVSFSYGREEISVIDDINFEIETGQTVALVGESGSGKSVTSLSIMQLLSTPGDSDTRGEILFEGKNLLTQSEREMCRLRGKEISMIFQEPMTSLNPVLTVGDQLVEIFRYHLRISKKEAEQKAKNMLEIVGIARADEILHEYPHRLSGGMRQRVMIAMAMCCQPKLLIADEPTTALDVTIQAQILDLLKDLNRTYNTSILLITHDLGIVSEVADKVIVLYAGQIVEKTKVEQLFEQPLHPYTKGLLASLPSLDKEVERLESIPGNVPLPDEMPQGCRFAPRCRQAVENCFFQKPPVREAKPGHFVRCFLH